MKSILLYYFVGLISTFVSTLILLKFFEIDHHIVSLVFLWLFPMLLVVFGIVFVVVSFLKMFSPTYIRHIAPNLIVVVIYAAFTIINYKQYKFNELDMALVLPHLISIIVVTVTFLFFSRLNSNNSM